MRAKNKRKVKRAGKNYGKKIESSVKDRSGFSTENDEAERLLRPPRSDNNRDWRGYIIKFPPWSSTPLKKICLNQPKNHKVGIPLSWSRALKTVDEQYKQAV